MLGGKEDTVMHPIADRYSILRRQRMCAATAWLVAGTALLVLTPLTAHTALLGWAPALWLVGAPLMLLLVLEPRLPLQLLAAAVRPCRGACAPSGAGTRA
jgi:hypothetical protein